MYMLTVLADHDYDEELFERVKEISTKQATSCVAEARVMRDAAFESASEAARACLNSLPPSFGKLQQLIPGDFRAAVMALVPRAEIQQYALRFDLELFVSALCSMADAALFHFEKQLTKSFPGARQINHASEMRIDDEVCLLIAPVKSSARVREKITARAMQHGNNMKKWPYAHMIGDFLRASVVLGNLDAYARAWKTIANEFDVHDGNGRLKVRRGNEGGRLCDSTMCDSDASPARSRRTICSLGKSDHRICS